MPASSSATSATGPHNQIGCRRGSLLWEWWREPGTAAEGIESCTTIPTDANEQEAQVQDRMPIALDAEDYDAWLTQERYHLLRTASLLHSGSFLAPLAGSILSQPVVQISGRKSHVKVSELRDRLSPAASKCQATLPNGLEVRNSLSSQGRWNLTAPIKG
jgi:hypothetical protein